MIKRLSKCIREYKKDTILSPVFITGEVVVECLIPFVIAELVNQIQAGCGLSTIASYGAILVIMALVSLTFGALSGKFCAIASCGFAKNLRHDLFYAVQKYSFSNIDKFSSSSLVTRLTTDVTNVQNAFMMIIRIAVRSPLMLIFSFTMTVIIDARLCLLFAVAIPLLAFGLYIIIKRAMPVFDVTPKS